jgi:protein-tyrosine phosphatase
MIDIHCHILPGVDDGAKSIEESMEMAKQAVLDGIHTIVATPHHNEKYSNEKAFILKQVENLNALLQQQNIPLTILPGQEPRIDGDMIQQLDNGQLMTLTNNSKYLFVELPSNHVPRYTEKLLYDIQLKGITPIIVHPERNQEIIENPELLYQLVKKGAITQLTASSVAGDLGKKIKKFCMQLVESNLTHLIASDAHNCDTRKFRLTQAYSELERKFGIQATYLFKENAELLISNKTVYKEVPERVKKSKLLGLF